MMPHSNSHYQWQKVFGLQGAAWYDGKAVTATGPHFVSLGNKFCKTQSRAWGWRMTAGIATLQNTSGESESEFSLVHLHSRPPTVPYALYSTHSTANRDQGMVI